MNDEIKEKVEELERRVKEIEEFIYSEENEVSTLDERIKDFANEMDLDVEELNKVFDFEDQPVILPEIAGDSKKEKQQKFVTIYLTALKYCYNKDFERASKLKEIAKNREIHTTTFGNNIKNFRPYLRQIGESRSATSKYKITHPKGTKKGMELIKGLAEVEENE